MEARAVYPQWIAKMYPGKTGRDHLGLGSVASFQILTTLSPSIYVLTYQPRYHSFYAFLLDEFWSRYKNANEVTPQTWIDFFRPRDFLFSVGANLHQKTSTECAFTDHVVGSQKTSGLIDKEILDYAEHQDYIKSRLGGYGLYYRGVMQEMGLILFGGRGYPIPVDMPTPEGKELAAAYREAVQDTRYYREYFDDDKARVPAEVLEEFMDRGCLCQLKKEDSPDHIFLRDLFLHRGEAEFRRHTFRLLLDIADQAKGHAVDEDAFRQLVYFQQADNSVSYSPSQQVITPYRYWRMAQLREYFSFALNTLWAYLCDWGISNNGDIRPLQMQFLWDHLHNALDFDALADFLGLEAPGLTSQSEFQSLLDWLSRETGATWQGYEEAFPRNVLDEHTFYRLAPDQPDLRVVAMTCMLGLIYLRFGHSTVRMRTEWAISKMFDHSGLGISVDGYIQMLQQRIRSGQVTVHEVLEWIFREYLILQHQVVANTKLPDNTFRFQREGDRLRFYPHNNPVVFMNARFEALTTTLFELGYCDHFSESDHALSNDGRQLLEKGEG